MVSIPGQRLAEVTVRRYTASPECDVVVVLGDHKMTLKCDDYSEAVKWARLECKAYKITDSFSVKRITN